MSSLARSVMHLLTCVAPPCFHLFIYEESVGYKGVTLQSQKLEGAINLVAAPAGTKRQTPHQNTDSTHLIWVSLSTPDRLCAASITPPISLLCHLFRLHSPVEDTHFFAGSLSSSSARHGTNCTIHQSWIWRQSCCLHLVCSFLTFSSWICRFLTCRCARLALSALFFAPFCSRSRSYVPSVRSNRCSWMKRTLPL